MVLANTSLLMSVKEDELGFIEPHSLPVCVV